MAMGLVITVATLAFLGFIGWLIYRAVRGRQVKAHNVTYGISIITGIFTYVFFLNMAIPELVKIVVSIFLGVSLIIVAAYLVQRRQPAKP